MSRSVPPGLLLYGRSRNLGKGARKYALKTRLCISATLSISEASYLRTRARAVLSQRENRCEACGYSPFVEVCHIVGLSEFPLGTPESTINHPRNLRKLCRNCHYELDHHAMNEERYQELMKFDGLQLTKEEILEGWHFCPEWDDLLIGPGMDEAKDCTCGASLNVAAAKKLIELLDSPPAPNANLLEAGHIYRTMLNESASLENK